MIVLIVTTLKGIMRDRIFQGIMVLGILLLFVPSAASLSMRQVTELSITLSLSLISFILLLLSVFLGGTSVWKEIERRYTYSVLSLPISRIRYLLGKFIGISLFLLATTIFLGTISLLVVKISAGIYPPDRPVPYGYILLALLFSSMKYLLLVAVAILLSTISTSFFLPIFGTICIFLASGVSQEVYEYLHSANVSPTIPQAVKSAATVLYYLIPNFAAFDLKVNAIYGVPVDSERLLLTIGYWVAYTAILLGGAGILFDRREMQ